MFTNVARVVYGVITIGTLISSQLVFSQSALEEIIVTAQKREQSLQDVPISVATVSGETILEQNFNRLEDMAKTSPGLYMNETRNGHNIFIRGIGTSDANDSFEQSTAQFTNGLYIGKNRSAQVLFLDVDRVEVLKGPQPTYFGNNAIAGGINTISKKPTKEWEGYINASYGFEFDDGGYQIAYGGPITDTLRIRFAGSYTDSEGFGLERTTGTTLNGREALTYRGSIQWQPMDQLVIDVMYEHMNLDQTPFMFELVGCNRNGTFPPGAAICNDLPADAPDEFVFDQAQALGGINPAISLGGADLTTRPDLFNIGRRTVDHELGRIEVNYDLNNGIVLSNVFGEYADRFGVFEDIDKTSIAGFHVHIKEVYRSRSNEFRITSPGGETLDWMAGHYWRQSKDKRFSPLSLGIMGGLYMANRFEEEADQWGFFGAATWNATDDVSFDFGARYTDIKKAGWRVENNVTANRLMISPDPAAGVPSFTADAVCFGTQTISDPCSYAIFKDTDLSYNVGINYQVPTLDTMVYAKHTTGYKAGGHPQAGVDLSDGLLNSFQFGAENAEAYEIGAKSTWLDGTLEVNLALFHNAISDLQVSVLDPVKTAAAAGQPVNVIANAGGAVTKGVELNGRWAPRDDLTFTYSAVYTDARYTEYLGAQCNQYEALTEHCTGVTFLAPMFGGALNNTGTRDRSGFTLEYVADVEAAIGTAWRTPSVADGMDLTLTADVYYNSGYNSSTLYLPEAEQGDYYRLDLRATLAAQDGIWSLSAFGANVNDKIVITQVKPSARNGPLDAFEYVSQRGAEYGIQFRYNFGTF